MPHIITFRKGGSRTKLYGYFFMTLFERDLSQYIEKYNPSYEVRFIEKDVNGKKEKILKIIEGKRNNELLTPDFLVERLMQYGSRTAAGWVCDECHYLFRLHAESKELSYQKIKKNLVLRAVGSKYLVFSPDEYIYRKINDIYLFVEYLANSDKRNFESFLLKRDLISDLPDTDVVINQAFENMEKLLPTTFSSLESIAMKCMKDEECDYSKIGVSINMEEIRGIIDRDRSGQFIVSNTVGIYGAANFFNPNVLKRLFEAFKKPYYMLPSSKHEVIICKDNIGEENLVYMVSDVNREQVHPWERLADNAYVYDGMELRAILN